MNKWLCNGECLISINVGYGYGYLVKASRLHTFGWSSVDLNFPRMIRAKC